MKYQVTASRRIVATVLLAANILATLWAIITDAQSFPAPVITLPVLIIVNILLWWPIPARSKTAWIWWKGK